MVVHYGHDPSLKYGDYFYLPFEAMTPYIVNNSKRVEGYVGVYKWCGDGPYVDQCDKVEV
jgi:hypothetical protein